MENDNILTLHPVLKKCQQDADALMKNPAALATLLGTYAILASVILLVTS